MRFATIIMTVLGLMPGMAAAQGAAMPVAGFAAGGAGLTGFYVIGFELGPWQEYLARELTPDYFLPEDAQPIHVSWLRGGELAILPDFAAGMAARPDTWLRLDMEWQSSAEYQWPVEDRQQTDTIYQGASFQREYLAPGLETSLLGDSVLGVSAVFAYQRYSAANLGLFAANSPDQASWLYQGYQPYQESAYGTGVRLAVREEVFRGVAVDAGFQSRIDMSEFATYRGVYAQSADLDIPARARVGVDFRASERSSLNVAIERVLYSDISAFPSRYLPNRFLSLLGDSTSPVFNWEDLTVYRFSYTWSDGKDQQWHLDLTTRTQPTPSSRLLKRALASDLASSAMVLGYSRRTGDRSQLAFNAAYAPPEFAFGGSVLGVTTDELDRRLEVETRWTVSF